MERPTGKLANLSLVSKYYPVANYSYPRKGSAPTTSNYDSRCSSKNSSYGRESVGSEGSAPGLIDDRTDSEVSVDDDYQYHTHTAELWDSFWPHRTAGNAGNKAGQDQTVLTLKQYPALIPSPYRKRQCPRKGGQTLPSWPLPSSTPPGARQEGKGNRRPAATYSVFPKTVAPPPSIALPPIPVKKANQPQEQPQRPQSPQKSSISNISKPLRPPRPANPVVTPSMQHTAFVPVNYAMADYIIRDESDLTPVSPTDCRPPTTSHDQRPSRSLDEAPSSRPQPCTIYSVISHSATHLPAPEIRLSPPKAPRHFKSVAALPSIQVPEREPHSVFEEDSDSEDENKSRPKFFHFHHKRSDSDQKRRRNRSNTSPSQESPLQEQFLLGDELQPSQRRHGYDVFGRLLGRRSR